MGSFAKIAIALTLLVVGISTELRVEAHEVVSAQHGAVSTYIEAYNAGDVDAMSALMHPHIQWIAVENGKSEVVGDGREALVEQMTDYLSSPMETRSSIGKVIENGRFLTTRETAHWKDSTGADKAQSSIAVYEFEDGLIRRVWYFPAQK